MNDTYLKLIRIFIASPGGLDEEREAIRSVIEDTNRQNSAHWGIRFDAVGWEETIGGNRRAQHLINKDLESCQYFFGILFDRWGSPPQGDDATVNSFTSGFEEEYCLADKLFESGSMGDLFLFFKKIPDDRLRDPGENLKKVLDFKKARTDAKRPLYFEFPDLDLFRSKIRDYLVNIGWRLFHEARGKETAPDHEPQSPPLKDDSPQAESSNTPLFPGDTEAFIQSLLNKEDQYDAVDAFEVARLRLVAASLYRSGNDTVQIGAHDANLIFRDRGRLSPSRPERNALISAGLANLGAQNLPLWHWVAGDDSKADILYPIQNRMFFGEGDINRYALRLAKFLDIDPPTIDNFFTRKRVVESWLRDTSPSEVRKEAASYLSARGTIEDLNTLLPLRENELTTNIAELDEIIIAIRTRQSLESGLDELISRDPEQVTDTLSNTLFSKPEAITSARLDTLSRLNAPIVRLQAVRELRRRNGIELQRAEELSGDSSPEIRYEAIIALIDAGVEISEVRAKNALEKKRGKGLLSLSGFGIDHDSLYKRYKRYSLSLNTLSELKQISDTESAHTADAFFAACVKFPKEMDKQLRSELQNGFEARFATKIDKLKEKFGNSADELVSQAQDLHQYSCRSQTDEGLRIISQRMRRENLKLVRHVLDSWEMTASVPVLAYLGRFGDWSDVDRVLGLKTANPFSRVFIHSSPDATTEEIARTLRVLSRRQISDLLEKTTDAALKSAVYRALSLKEMAQRHDDLLLADLNQASDQLRKTVALRCIDALSKNRVANLLDRYVNRDDHRFYNVIHWLDLGASMPTSIAKVIVRAELAEM